MTKQTAALDTDIGSNVDHRENPLDEIRGKRPAPLPSAAKKKEPTVRIVLEESEAIPPTGQFIQVNGKSWMLRPGVEVDVPISVLDALNHAVEEHPVREQGTGKVVGYRKRMRFPYRRVPTAREMEARTLDEGDQAA